MRKLSHFLRTWLLAALFASPLVAFSQDDDAYDSPPVPGSSQEWPVFESNGDDCACDACPAPECNCAACQQKKVADLKKAVAGAYAPLFYNNNFSYLNNP